MVCGECGLGCSSGIFWFGFVLRRGLVLRGVGSDWIVSNRFGAGLGGVLLRCLALCWGDGIEVRFLLALALVLLLVGIGPDDRWTVLRTGSLACVRLAVL